MTQHATSVEILQSAAYIRSRLGGKIPEVAMILGSGLDTLVASIEDAIRIPYCEIPHFPVSTVSYQKGELICGDIEGKTVLCMSGRFHYYEGWEMWQSAYPIYVFRALGISAAIITNAAGGIDPEILPGTLVLLEDHIKLAPDSPLRGSNLDEFGTRFPDMQSVYDKELLALADSIAFEQGIRTAHGVYAYMTGPQYETPSEIRALRILGGTVVGMSTVPEVIAAAHCGIRVLGISCVSNAAAGITGSPLTTEEVLDTAFRIANGFEKLIRGVIHGMKI